MYLQDTLDLLVITAFIFAELMNTELPRKLKQCKKERLAKKFVTITTKSIKKYMIGLIVILIVSDVQAHKNKLKLHKISSKIFYKEERLSRKLLINNIARNVKDSLLTDLSVVSAQCAIIQTQRVINVMDVEN